MIKVLLVDDEPLILNVIKNKVPWESFGMEIVGTALDGQNALEFIQKNDIDIVFTDVKMPHMDGNEFIQMALQIKHDTKFVVLSSYSDFPLVKKAFQAGAIDYILKVDIDSQVMLDILQHLKDKVSQKQVTNAQLEIYIRGLMSNEKKSMKGNHFIVAVIPRISESDENLIKNNLHILEKIYKIIWLFSHNEVVIVFNLEELSLKTGSVRQNPNISEILRGLVLKNAKSNYFLGISNIGQLNKIDELYLQAKKQIELSEFYSKPDEKLKSESSSDPSNAVSISKAKEDIRNALTKIDPEKCIKIMIDFMDHLEEYRFVKDIVQDSVSEIYIYMINHMYDLKLLPSEVNNDINYINRQIHSLNIFADLKHWVINQLSKIKTNFHHEKSENLIKLIAIYIENNFEKDLVLGDVAKHFGISEGYLCRKFSKETGIHFKEYINLLRIEKAKYLLTTTNIRLTEICEKIGFANVEHFSRVFKEHIGISPNLYKRSLPSP
jgi:Response regulator containing CheY-like receiver domain and AraC-type DNA-binding domain